jgi:hypothetical protein
MWEPFPLAPPSAFDPSGPHANKTRGSQQWHRTGGWLSLGCRVAGEIPATHKWPRTNLGRIRFSSGQGRWLDRRARSAPLLLVGPDEFGLRQDVPLYCLLELRLGALAPVGSVVNRVTSPATMKRRHMTLPSDGGAPLLRKQQRIRSPGTGDSPSG